LQCYFPSSITDNKNSSTQQRNQKNNQHTIKKQQKPDKKNKADSKINYVLAPKKILEKRMEIKESVKAEKEKSFQKSSKCFV
jgi:hypothetical protein